MRWVDTAAIYCLVSFTVVVRSECTGYEHPFCSDAGSIPHSTLSHSGDSAIAYQVAAAVLVGCQCLDYLDRDIYHTLNAELW